MFKFLFIFIIPIQAQTPSNLKRITIWNVGQGQWTTYERWDICLHIDVGGEIAPWKHIIKKCHNKKNFIILSHFDWDHIKFSNQLARRLTKTCILNPKINSKNKFKDRFLKRILPCKSIDFKTIQNESNLEFVNQSIQNQSPDSNTMSLVFTLENTLLIPGDSNIKMEKKWVSLINNKNKLQSIILGHHGSNTSTSKKLLKKLPNLTQAFASARKKKYGHPHPLLLTRIKKHHISLLCTEKWNSITLEL